MSALLEVEGLRTRFATKRGIVQAVDDVSLVVQAGETVGIVGESGSGKSIMVRSVMGLVADVPGCTVEGSIRFNGVDLATLEDRQRRAFWGPEIAMVFQNPMNALNPVKKLGHHLMGPLRHHLGMTRREARARAEELLVEVGIPEPRRRLDQYPHELSGGMRQRVCIALALTCRPKLLIADEPTTALDVTVQRQILDLLQKITGETGMATILISHDLGVVAKRAQRVGVMYAGRLVEHADSRSLFHRSRHPYADALLAAVPRLADPPHHRLAAIAGSPPDLTEERSGCAFADRCGRFQPRCAADVPVLRGIEGPTHLVACHHPVPRPASGAQVEEGQS